MQNRDQGKRGGFTFSELLIAVVIFGIVTAFVTPCMTVLMRFARGGSQQARFTMEARQSELKLSRFVQTGFKASVFSNRVQITSTTLTVSRISYEDLDGDPSTLSNNVIQFDPNIWEDDDEETICTYVSPIPGEPMFTNLAMAADAIRFRYHIGEATNVKYTSRFSSSPGFQGIEVRFSATPHNLMTWYDEE